MLIVMPPKVLSLSLSLLLGAAFAPLSAQTVVFADDFSTDGFLGGQTPQVGGTWIADSGDPLVSGGVMDTSSSFFDQTRVFASMSRALGQGEILTLTMNTVTPSSGNWATNGFAGVGLFYAGSERIFFGSPGNVFAWGVDQDPGKQPLLPLDTDPIATGATVTYNYDTGAWTASANGSFLSGFITAGIAFDSIEIISDINNLADIAITDIQVVVPEPTTASLTLGGLGLLLLRRRRK